MGVDLSKVTGVDYSDVADEVSKHCSLRDVLAWAGSKPREHVHPHIVAEVVVQDEFTHDVIVPYRGLFLVYDTT